MSGPHSISNVGFEKLLMRVAVSLPLFWWGVVTSLSPFGTSFMHITFVLGIISVLSGAALLIGYRTRIFAIVAVIALSLSFIKTVILSVAGQLMFGQGHMVNSSNMFPAYILYISMAVALVIWGGGKLSLDYRLIKVSSDEQNVNDNLLTLLRVGVGIIIPLSLFDMLLNLHKTGVELIDLFGDVYFIEDVLLVFLCAFVAVGLFTRLSMSLLFMLKAGVVILPFLKLTALSDGYSIQYQVPLLFVSLILVVNGPGRYSVDRWLVGKRAAGAGG